ncbi:hypothetical protein FIU89_03290 [Roseovarius sp. THAF27]|uniref:DUF4339 domain-containing protein n=1 Tax=Roseovarius sp. THAF27 TaxID=2587850 RepID=UPI00126861A4|nr:DUF4339 domain-containing protein [Roseovarius sp. THAF27]QFT79623.1 hypothetical protein FIU89_03290 [Roseovarius sp. THAF27]
MDSFGKFAARLPGALAFALALWLVASPLAAQEGPPFEGYYVVENGQAVGPLPASEMQARLRDGRVTDTSLVWKKGMQDWEAARFRPDLGAELGPPAERDPQPDQTVQDFGRYLAGTWTSEAAQAELPEVGQVDVVSTITFGTDGIFTLLTEMSSVAGAPQPMTVHVEGNGTFTLSGATTNTVTVSYLGTSLTKVEGQAGAGWPDQLQFDTTIKAIDQGTFFEDGSTYRKVSQ